jgi:Domain of unknown function (DUF4333)
MRFPVRRLGAAGLATAALAAAGTLAGCGGSERPPPRKVDVVAIQKELTRTRARRTLTTVDQMACPAAVARAGRTFECTATFDGEPGLVVVTLTDATGRHYTARMKNVLLGRLEGAIHNRAARDGFPVASVDCPGPIPQRRGQISLCTIEDRQGRDVRVKVTQLDDRGNISIEPVR